MSQTDQPDQSSYHKSSVLNLLVRLYWFLFGYFFTLYSIKEIFYLKAQFFSFGDFLYWLSFILLIGMRFIDVKFLHGDTADGNPATIKDFFQYLGIMTAVFLMLWLGLHFIVSISAN
jgi:hypothetical protein